MAFDASFYFYTYCLLHSKGAKDLNLLTNLSNLSSFKAYSS
nr:MAG TPA: hypothetical protein [Caudoviricetes sp.]